MRFTARSPDPYLVVGELDRYACRTIEDCDRHLAGMVARLRWLANLAGSYYGGRNAPNVTASSYGGGSLTGGTYTGNGSLATSWPGMNSTWG